MVLAQLNTRSFEIVSLEGNYYFLATVTRPTIQMQKVLLVSICGRDSWSMLYIVSICASALSGRNGRNLVSFNSVCSSTQLPYTEASILAIAIRNAMHYLANRDYYENLRLEMCHQGHRHRYQRNGIKRRAINA